MAGQYDDLMVRVGADIKALQKELRRAQREADISSRGIKDAVEKSGAKSALDELDAAAGRAKKGMMGMGAAVLGGLGLFELSRHIISTASEFEQLRARLETVTGSSANAAKAMEMIMDVAKTTPYQVQDVTDAFIRLKAYGLDAGADSLRAYGNIAAAMGKTLEQTIEAAADASRGEFERLKEFGIQASKQGDQVSFMFQGVRTTVKNTSGDITKYLKSIGEVNFAGAMERQSKTFGGAISNMQDTIDSLANAFGGESGLTSIIAEAIRDLSGAAGDSTEEAAAFGAAFAEVIATMLDATVTGTATIKTLFVSLGDGLGGYAAAIKALFTDGVGAYNAVVADIESRQKDMWSNLVENTDADKYRQKLHEIQDNLLAIKAASSEGDGDVGGNPNAGGGGNAAEKVKKAVVDPWAEAKAETWKMQQDILASTATFLEQQSTLTADALQADLAARQSAFATLQELVLGESGWRLKQAEEDFAARMEQLDALSTAEQDMLGGQAAIREAAEREHREKILAIQKQALQSGYDFLTMIKDDETRAIADGWLSALRTGATYSKKLFEANKIFAIGDATIKAYQAAQNAFAAAPWPANFAAAAAALAQGFMNVKAIQATKFGGGGAASSVPGAANGNNTTPASGGSSSPLVSVTLNGSSFSDQQVRDLVDKINEAYADGAG